MFLSCSNDSEAKKQCGDYLSNSKKKTVSGNLIG